MKLYIVQCKTPDGSLVSKMLDRYQISDILKKKNGDNQVVSVFSFDDQNTLIRLKHRVSDLVEVKYHEFFFPDTGIVELSCLAI